MGRPKNKTTTATALRTATRATTERIDYGNKNSDNRLLRRLCRTLSSLLAGDARSEDDKRYERELIAFVKAHPETVAALSMKQIHQWNDDSRDSYCLWSDFTPLRLVVIGRICESRPFRSKSSRNLVKTVLDAYPEALFAKVYHPEHCSLFTVVHEAALRRNVSSDVIQLLVSFYPESLKVRSTRVAMNKGKGHTIRMLNGDCTYPLQNAIYVLPRWEYDPEKEKTILFLLEEYPEAAALVPEHKSSALEAIFRHMNAEFILTNYKRIVQRLVTIAPSLMARRNFWNEIPLARFFLNDAPRDSFDDELIGLCLECAPRSLDQMFIQLEFIWIKTSWSTRSRWMQSYCSQALIPDRNSNKGARLASSEATVPTDVGCVSTSLNPSLHTILWYFEPLWKYRLWDKVLFSRSDGRPEHLDLEDLLDFCGDVCLTERQRQPGTSLLLLPLHISLRETHVPLDMTQELLERNPATAKMLVLEDDGYKDMQRTIGTKKRKRAIATRSNARRRCSSDSNSTATNSNPNFCRHPVMILLIERRPHEDANSSIFTDILYQMIRAQPELLNGQHMLCN